MMTEAADWIANLQLAPHPEGGYFRETYRAAEAVPVVGLPERFQGERSHCTAIYFLLEHPQVSHLHRIKSDEIWHFYAGSSLTVYVIEPQGQLSEIHLGSNPTNGEVFQAVVTAGCWFGAAVPVPNSYALVGCTVAPGFDFHDFELGQRELLVNQYPQHQVLIERLTHAP